MLKDAFVQRVMRKCREESTAASTAKARAERERERERETEEREKTEKGAFTLQNTVRKREKGGR